MELMELQLKHRVELLLAEERICLEINKQELAVRKACVLYLESVNADSEFQERTGVRCHLCRSGLLVGNPTRRDLG